AGGSIWIDALSIAGTTGSISADGGNSGGLVTTANGGGGSGGRIAVSYGSTSITNITALGGTGNQVGGAGTIFTKDIAGADAQVYGNLTIKNSGTSGPETPLTSAVIGSTNVTYNSLIVQNGAIINIPSGVTITGENSGSYTFSGVTNNGTLSLNNISSLTNTGTITNNGTLSLNNISSLTNTGTITNNSTLSLNNAGFTNLTTGNITNSGKLEALNLTDLTIDAGKTFSINTFSAATTNFPLLTTVTISGILKHNQNTTTQVNFIDLRYSGVTPPHPNLANINITSTGSIDVTGKGYAGVYQASGSGTGGGNGGLGSVGAGGGGAAYGGNGGNGWGSATSYAGSTIIYGSATQPTELGSAGGGTYNTTGGNGGGAVKLLISGTLTLDGSIVAKGGNGNTNSTSKSAGGGAGGSIWIDALSIAGTTG
ncbi:MAG: hypothetical protein Q8N28_01890, partial [bacterium]|nr:hypothetical protein [bacterium]